MTLKIGIPAQNHDDKFGVNINYLEFIYQFGNPVIISPIEKEDFLDTYNIDALVLPGGSDVDSKRYAKLPALANYAPNIHLEHFDKEILPILVGNLPIFGICRGLQTLNVFFGGTLRNLFWHQISGYDTHEIHKIVFYDKGIRPLDFNSKGIKKMGVNSFHHQAIDKLANNFQIETESEFGGIIEAITDYKRKIAAVQWHPERLLDNYSVELFQSIMG